MSVDIEAIASELMMAYETGKMVAVPPSSQPGFDLDAAYVVESKLKAGREHTGHKSVGRKVGYANKAMWRILKLETLVWGHMYDDTVHQSVGNSTTLSLAHPRSLKIEPEIIFGMQQPITASGLDAAAALAAVDWLAIGFEIIDCPYPDWKFQPADFVASFGLHAALVIGERMPIQPASIPQLADELAKFKVKMLKNGDFVEEGSGKNSLRSPALCLAELGDAIAKRSPDEPLTSGEIVSTGTLTAGHLTSGGDRWTVELEGISLPSLTLILQ
jgi:2-keto-4-pentenoate hydratase